MKVLACALAGAALATSAALGAEREVRESLSPPARQPRWTSRGRPAVDSGPRALLGGLLALQSYDPGPVKLRRAALWVGSTPEELAVLVATGGGPRWAPAGRLPAVQALALESPARRVEVPTFWMDRREVTVADWERCVRRAQCRALDLPEGSGRLREPAFPVAFVDRADARAYCASRGARLPSEAEFERAARGPERRTWPWGFAWNSRAANHGREGWSSTDDTDGAEELAPVGSYPSGASPEGLLDLAGNVAEWVEGEARLTATSPSSPSLTASLTLAVARGGGWDQGPLALRGAARAPEAPSERRASLGFRCAHGPVALAPP